jgi:arsenate reductase (thioredoxin)
MGEALLRHLGGDRFKPLSAGTHPAGFVHPLVLETMKRMGVSTNELYSKSVYDLADSHPDIVLTVCDNAAREPCPIWPGKAVTAHWGLPDPAFAPGTEEERLTVAGDVAAQLRRWIEQLISLPLDNLPPGQLKAELARIASI